MSAVFCAFLVTSGTQVTQPLAELWKVHSANDIAAAEIKATRSKAQQMENKVALQVHQIYYKVLILHTHRESAQAGIRATEDLRSERVEQVKYGETLEQESIEARAQALNSRQNLLATELQLSDAIGLPMTTQFVLDPAVNKVHNSCQREECLRIARDPHPEIREAHAEVEKASAAVRFAKRQYIPSLDAVARHSYQDNVPFLAATSAPLEFTSATTSSMVGNEMRRSASANPSLLRANLARIQDEVDLRVQTAYNKLELTGEMVKVSEELLALRTEVHRVSVQQLQQGAALRSQVDSAAAQELYARTSLLQSQLDYLEAQDEMLEAEGLAP